MPPPWAVFKMAYKSQDATAAMDGKLQATDKQREFMMTVHGPHRYFIILSFNCLGKERMEGGKTLKTYHSSTPPPPHSPFRLRPLKIGNEDKEKRNQRNQKSFKSEKT